MRFYTFLLFLIQTIYLFGQSKPPSEENLEKLNALVTKLDSKGFYGTILVAHKDSILFAKGYGFRDAAKQLPNTRKTIFGTGSLTKQFTAAAILKLEMQGKLSVRNKINMYFPQLPSDLKDIQIHHLLTHSAGFPVAIGSDYDAISENEFIDQAFAAAERIKPGSHHEYSNVGYALLSIIIEKVSGISYEAYLKKNLFDPAGLENTGYVLPDWDVNSIAKGYTKKEEWGKPNDKPWNKDAPYLHLKGNGGLLSTVEDLFKWHLALKGDEILSQEAKAKYYGKHIEEIPGEDSYYGYGWVIIPTGDGTDLVTHNGGNGIFFADFWRLFDEELTIIMMTNKATNYTEDLCVRIARTLLN